MMTRKSISSGVTSGSVASDAAKKRGDKRTEDVRERVRTTMAAIEKEMASNEGIYPHRNGALSSAEVARRAGIHPTSFFTEKLRGLGVEVKSWLNNLKAEKVVGTVKVNRTLAQRLSDWKGQYEGLLQSHRDTELELQETQHQLAEARVIIEDFKRQVACLQGSTDRAKAGTALPLRPSKTDFTVELERAKKLEPENATLRERLTQAAPLKVVPLKPQKPPKD